MKYKVTSKVHGFRFKGVSYPAGSIVDMPDGANIPEFLQPVKEEVVIVKATTQEKPAEVALHLEAGAPTEKVPRRVVETGGAHIAESLEELGIEPKPRGRRAKPDA